MKVPWIPRPLIPKAVEQGGAAMSASQLQLARETAAVAARTCASRWCKTFGDPASAPVAELVSHTTEAQFIVGSIFGTQQTELTIPWYHQAGQYGVVCDITLVTDFSVVLGFRFASRGWMTTPATYTYSDRVSGKPWQPVQHELWVRKSWKYGGAQAITLTAQLSEPALTHATTNRSILLSFYVQAQTEITQGPFGYSGDHLVYVSDIRLYDTLDPREYP